MVATITTTTEKGKYKEVAMRFIIRGNIYDIDRANIIDAVSGVAPEMTDGRHKYDVDIDGTRYPIKQVLSLTIGQPNGLFDAGDAIRVLTKNGFSIEEIEPSPPPRPQQAVREARITKKYDASPEGKTAIRFAVTLEGDEDGYITASCPALVGCHSQGRSRSEAIKNVQEAIRGYIASMANHGESVPDVDWEVVEVAA